MYIVTEELPPSPTQSQTLFFWNTTQDLVCCPCCWLGRAVRSGKNNVRCLRYGRNNNIDMMAGTSGSLALLSINNECAERSEDVGGPRDAVLVAVSK